MNIIIKDNNYLNKFFHKEKKYENYIKSQIINNIELLIKEKPYKIKIVKGCKYRDKTIWEYKIDLEENLACRVAYIIDGDDIMVFFISTTIIKYKFTKLVCDFIKNNKHSIN